MKYDFHKIERRWQQKWEELDAYKAVDFDEKRKKHYTLIEFPYPSGDGLHVGHVRSYTALDAIARWKRMQGYNVLYPIGWDAFGLPTENYAIKNKIHPAEATKDNVKNFKRQLKSLGLSFDWPREVNTTDPDYYKWTQWIFLQFYKADLAYRAEISINWCLSCKVGLANEEVVEGCHERCDTKVTRKLKKQWLFKITAYADRLLEDLKLVDYPERVKSQQINWIGKSKGTLIKFPIFNPPAGRAGSQFSLDVFTTRADTLFGATYMVVAPEHPLVVELLVNHESRIMNHEEVEEYVKTAGSKSDLERTAFKEKTGVELKGITAVNPTNDKEIPVWVADYVLPDYGTGAIMAVPAHDERDFEFATKFKLPIVEVISPDGREHKLEDAYIGEGVLINSGKFNDLKSKEASEKITEWLAQEGKAEFSTFYKLRDWVFSRQHYWGEPIPIVYCEKCGEVPVPESELPVKLPEVKNYEPIDTGESPLAAITDWVNTKCPKCDGPAKRETDTMPNWAGSNWYFCRYTDPQNDKVFADKKKLKYWMPVNLYNGGMEHTTLHLLYSRFVYKFLYDKGFVPGAEPYAKRTSHGVVLAEDGRKMSKSYNNVISPDEVVEKFGADTIRLYEMFIAPFEQMVVWNSKSVIGVYRFLERVWKLYQKHKVQITNDKQNTKYKVQTNPELENGLKKLIRKIIDDLKAMKFNTAVAAFMEFSNKMIKAESVSVEVLKTYLILLAPFAPHLTEELWSEFGHKDSVHSQKWPEVEEGALKEETMTLVVQVNGKVRDTIEIKSGISQQEAEKLALASEKIQKHLGNQKPKKIIFTGKLINLVV